MEPRAIGPGEDAAVPGRAPLQMLRDGVRTRAASPLDDPVHRGFLWAAGLSVLAAGLHLIPGPGDSFRAWLMGFAAVPAWVFAVRTLQRDASAVRFWRIWLGAGALFVLVSGASQFGAVMATAFSLAFLVIRRYRVLRHLRSARRAQVFFLAGVSLGLLLFRAPDAEPRSWLNGVGVNLANTAVWSLRAFWFLVLVRLFISTRLHFLNIRPKLALTAALFGLVPLVLGLGFAAVALFGALGGSRAQEVGEILAERAALVAADPDLGRTWFGDPVLPGVGEEAREVRELIGAGILETVPADSAAYGSDRGRLWLVVGGEDGGRFYRVDDAALSRLSQRVRCELEFHGEDDLTIATDDSGDDEAERDWLSLPYFGATVLEVLVVDGAGLRTDDALMVLRTTPRALWSEFAESGVNQALLVALGVIAGLFLILELVALSFGARITGSVVSAVRTLHKGTERMARGELDVELEIPNEDELGDLADSFNEMTRAVQRGQEEALARERLEQEVATARRIQERLLPRGAPELDGWAVVGSSVPSTQVGGDYYDFLPLADGRLGIAIGDVTGKGVPAALLMSNLQASLQGQVIHSSPVAEVMARVNDLLAASTDAHMFATFYYGELDLRAATLRGCSAGHEPPIVRRADGTVEMLDAGGLILGMLPDQTYEEVEIALSPGDAVILYTDGITEAMGPVDGRLPATAEDEDFDPDDTNFFGLERLLEVIRDHPQASAAELRDAILDAVHRHAQGVAQSDDITLVVLHRHREAGAA